MSIGGHNYKEPLQEMARGETNQVYIYNDAFELEVEITRGKLFVPHFYISEDYREDNNGTNLLEEIISTGESRDCGHIEIHIQPTQEGGVDASRKLLEKFHMDVESAGIANEEIDEILVGRRRL